MRNVIDSNVDRDSIDVDTGRVISIFYIKGLSDNIRRTLELLDLNVVYSISEQLNGTTKYKDKVEKMKPYLSIVTTRSIVMVVMLLILNSLTKSYVKRAVTYRERKGSRWAMREHGSENLSQFKNKFTNKIH